MGGVGGWDNTWLSEGQGGGLGDSHNASLTDVRALGDGDHGRLRTVGGVTSDGDVGGHGGDVGRNLRRGGVRVGGQRGGGQGGQGSESRELHCEGCLDVEKKNLKGGASVDIYSGTRWAFLLIETCFRILTPVCILYCLPHSGLVMEQLPRRVIHFPLRS